MRIVLIILAFIVVPAAAYAHSAMDRFWGEVPVDMTISGDVLVTKPLIIPEDVTLTIEPGTVVRFEGSDNGDNRIVVKGRLVAAGTGDKPVRFIPKDGNSGPWYGIEFAAGSTGRLEHCVIKGSANGLKYAGPKVVIKDVEVK
jgi:hypothetical protein